MRDIEGGTFTFGSEDICICDPSRALHKHHPHVDPRVTEQILLAVKKGKDGGNNATGTTSSAMPQDSFGLGNGQFSFTGANTSTTWTGGGYDSRNMSKNNAGLNATHSQRSVGDVMVNGRRGKDKDKDANYKGWAWEAYEKRQAEIKKKKQEAQDRRERVRICACVHFLVRTGEGVYACAYVCVYVCVCVCTSTVRERERERDASVHACVSVCVMSCTWLIGEKVCMYGIEVSMCITSLCIDI